MKQIVQDTILPGQSGRGLGLGYSTAQSFVGGAISLQVCRGYWRKQSSLTPPLAVVPLKPPPLLKKCGHVCS